MARNEEKSNAMLNKWINMQSEAAHGGPKKRPYLASECDDLTDAERWRRQIVNQISRKVSDIQNVGLGEARIRDLNDEINKLFREKHHWEKRIVELGGPDYTRVPTKMVDSDGKELPGSGGYMYFGAARELPGVKELFQEMAEEKSRRSRAELFKAIKPDYYGYRDEEDGELVKAEAEAEKIARAQLEREYEEMHAKRKREREEFLKQAEQGVPSSMLGTHGPSKAARKTEIIMIDTPREDIDEEEAELSEHARRIGSLLDNTAAADANIRSHVAVPSQEEISQLVLKKKKELLLAKYATSNLQQSQSEAQGFIREKAQQLKSDE